MLIQQSLMRTYCFVNNIPIIEIDYLGLLQFHWWGNYCGPGYCGGGENKETEYPPKGQTPIPPTDAMDQACLEHDACLGGWDPVTGAPQPRQGHDICDPKICENLDNIDICDLLLERPDVDAGDLERKLRFMRNAFCRLGPF